MSIRLRHLGLALIAAVPVPAAAQQPERHTLTGDRVAIYDLAGQIRIDPGTGTDVVVEITRGGRDLGQLRVERGPVESMPGYETLRVLFPSDEISYPALHRGSRTQMSIRDDGTFNDHDNNGRKWGRHSDRRVTITSYGSGLEAWADLHITVPAGKRVDVNVGVGDITVTNVDGHLSVDGNSSTVTARGTKGNFNVDVGSGSVTVNDAQGQVSIDTGSGDVELTTFKGTDLSIDTGSGSVSGTTIAADAVNVDTGSGSITLSGVSSPDLKLDTGSGDVDLDLVSDVDAVSIDTGSGSVTLHVPADVGAVLDIESSSGGVESDIPLEVTKWGSDRVAGRIGDGKGRIAVETGSGRVRIVKRLK